MTTPTAPTQVRRTFTPAECSALRPLLSRYHQDWDLGSGRERAHLRFVRWLSQTEHFVPKDAPTQTGRPEGERGITAAGHEKGNDT